MKTIKIENPVAQLVAFMSKFVVKTNPEKSVKMISTSFLTSKKNRI